MFLNVGLMSSTCGLNLLDFTSADMLQVNQGCANSLADS